MEPVLPNLQRPQKQRKINWVGKNMVRYQQKLKSFYNEHNTVLKRHIEVSPTTENVSTEANVKKKHKRYDKNDPSFLLPGHS